jgi:tetratricopeptide (TPR) repeat protein
LQWIKWLLALIAISLFLGAVALVYFGKSLTSSQFKSSEFTDHALALREAGKYEELIELADARQKTHGEDANVFWYRGYANFRLKRYEQALSDYERAAQIEPSWKASHIDMYVEQIKAEMKQ